MFVHISLFCHLSYPKSSQKGGFLTSDLQNSLSLSGQTRFRGQPNIELGANSILLEF
jgi:hypothetical protein